MPNIFTKDTSPKTNMIISLVALAVFLPFLIFAAIQTVKLISRAAGIKANIVVDASTVLEPLNSDFYHAFAQGGEESTDMLAPVVNEVSALKPKIIRLDHLTDHYDLVGGSSGNLTFDFSKLDAAVNTILATGAKPMLSLSFMPAVIAKDGIIINPPNNWSDWSAVVQRIIEHYSGKNERNLTGIFYEVWNEPDLATFGSWHYGSKDKNYTTLYRYASIGANNAKNVNRFYLGGPSTTGLYKSWIIALVKSGARVDFFSWHTYQADPVRYDQDQKNLISWLLPYPRYVILPKLITEFGFTGDKSRNYGTTYAGAHAAAVIRQLISGGPTYLFAFEPKDGPGQEAGDGWGLITHESNGKKFKPRYHVFNFLDQAVVGNRVLLKGEGTWVTGFASIKDKVLRVFLVNFDTRGAHTETVPVAFTNLAPGQYAYRERFLFGRDNRSTISVTSAPLVKQVFMPAQSMAILELTPQ